MWEEKRLGDICTKIGSGATPNGGSGAYKESGFSLIRSQNVLDFSFSEDGLAFIDGVQAEKLKGVTVEKGDVLLNITGDSVARSCIVPNRILPARVNQHVSIIRPDQNKASNIFVFYYTQYIKPYLLSIGSNGGTRNALTKAIIEDLKITIPPLPTQQKIADILSAYDDLIENNNRRIELLEQAAQQLYKEWFVRFRFPEYETAHFTKGIPDGWEVVKLEDVVEIGRGSSPRPIADQKYFENGNIPWIKIADATASKMYITETKEYVNEFGASFSRKLKPGSLILAASGTLGFPMFLGIEGCIHDGWLYFDNFNGISPKYLYYNLISLTERFNAFSYGAAIQNINTGIVKNTKSILPPLQLQNIFDDKISIIHGQIRTLQAKNQNLIKQRDLLLPRLMSGKLDV